MADKKRQFNVRIDGELVEWLKNYSKDSHRKVPDQLTYILEQEKARAEAEQNPTD
ncbi:hypothetical protein [Psychrobacter sp.]|uniref:hypothetical protein n=1 Tax=Psychrobacter sp. TaxID=56811 RepID=UPI003BB17725